ncbi:hypothetical protein FE257_012317 [Aspergillus nanangensis]|uniref:chitinase n=1 Tax=Aspergillus nanangensis TaxID=2582783 RepID=A0AAD4CG36_ASPNN|nr:hypothetical protein FE257_012317 [Aspergillus nanangensis]
MRFLGSFYLAALVALYVPTSQALRKPIPVPKPCPSTCSGTPEAWGVYSSIDSLRTCDEPVLLKFNVHTFQDMPVFKACTAGNATKVANALVTGSTLVTLDPNNQTVVELIQSSLESEDDTDHACISAPKSQTTLELVTSASERTSPKETVVGILEELQSYALRQTDCTAGALFGYYRGVTAGFFVGAAVTHPDTVSTVMGKFHEYIDIHEVGGSSMSLQRCNDSSTSDHTIGVAVDGSGTFDYVQSSVKAWYTGGCQVATDHTETIKGVTIRELAPTEDINQSLSKRADAAPKPNADGTCASYVVGDGDICASIAAAYSTKVSTIEANNKGTTWGWNGCGNLPIGLRICLSSGKPPMPAPVSNAVCGPTVAGTEPPSGDDELEDLNPCPLNACCNVWGQCGITTEFCLKEIGPTGNPGTSPIGKNGCVQNCGTDIANDYDGAPQFSRLGYYESWNFDRPCLNLRAENADTEAAYTHMHWAFGLINDDWSISVNDTFKQWEDFKALSLKRIMSLGGWGYSTEPATYDKLRKAMTAANRNAFATGIVNFINKHGLDGIDIDWEYPGAPEGPGVPTGLPTDGPNYLSFLKVLRNKLPSDKTMSIAAPASYWYLQSFPIDQMAEVLDYIVYMTYDLHGQWDYDNQWASEGCPAGNCVRSHVNLTETMYTLAMITKAGVPTNKINVGVSSYGRSFKMEDPDCDKKFDCPYVGPESGAEPGSCTDTAGYLANAEIKNILDDTDSGNPVYFEDEDSDSDIVTWGDGNWVSYMSSDRKNKRRERYFSLNFAGTVDWAVDLQEFTDDDFSGAYGNEEDLPDADPLPDCDGGDYSTLEALDDDLANIPSNCRFRYTLKTLGTLLDTAMTDYSDILDDGYDDKFDTYASAVADSAPFQVKNFTNNNGDKYFTCTITEPLACCKVCSTYFEYCQYCDEADKCEIDVGHGNHYVVLRYANYTEPCPPDMSARGGTGDWSQSVYWKLKASKAQAFWADLYDATGIEQKNIEWTNHFNWTSCNGMSDEECRGELWDYNFPAPVNYDKDDVDDPKDVVETALAKLKGLPDQISSILSDLEGGNVLTNMDEIIDSISLPIFMVMEAVENMEQVVDIAEDIEEEKRKQILYAFLGAILFLVPVAGEVLGAVTSLATIGRIVALAGVAGNAAFDVYNVVKEGDNDPLAIMSIILAPLALLDVGAVAKAAKIRRSMSPEEMIKLGTKLNGRMKVLERVVGVCRA